MRPFNTTIIKLSLVLLLGVVAGFYMKLPAQAAFILVIIALGPFLISFFRARKLLFKDVLLGISAYLLLFSLGIFTTAIHLPENQKLHYIQHISPENDSEEQALKIKIREVLKPDLYNYKYIASVESINQQVAHGKILVLLPKNSEVGNWDVGDRFLIISELNDIPKPLNPHQFDYHRFMKMKGILKQTTLSHGNLISLPPENGLLASAHFFRKKVITNLKRNGFRADELAIIQALLLGQKQDISKETYNNYAAAGAIHILAVSGLHVGIILFMLNFLLSPLERLKKGRFLKTILIIVFLWIFALVAGLSPSVVRAVTMFSFLAVGLSLNRRTGTLNSLFLSLLFLVLFNPSWVLEVGFQLSYLAVLSILLIQPPLYELWQPPNKVMRYTWGLLTTTTAAQIGVLPVSLFYFHQFPGLFFISNLVILPFLAFILGFGFLVILLSGLNMLPSQLSKAYSWIIETLNNFVAFIARKESFLFKDISFDLTDLLAFYLLLGCLYLLIVSFSYRKLVITLITVIMIQAIYLTKTEQASEEKLIVFHQPRKTNLVKVEGPKITFMSTRSSEEIPQAIRNYMTGEEIDIIEAKRLQNVLMTKNEIMILIDSTGIYPKENVEYLMITGSPKLNLERCLNVIAPKMVIADGSNYPYSVAQWKETCLKKEIPFHYTGEKGALILK